MFDGFDEEVTDINDLREKMQELMNDAKSGKTRVKKQNPVLPKPITSAPAAVIKEKYTSCVEHQLSESICAMMAGSSSSLDAEDQLDKGQKSFNEYQH